MPDLCVASLMKPAPPYPLDLASAGNYPVGPSWCSSSLCHSPQSWLYAKYGVPASFASSDLASWLTFLKSSSTSAHPSTTQATLTQRGGAWWLHPCPVGAHRM